IESMFESFVQTSSDTSRKYEGLGLGLTIAKSIVELHGGKIDVVSKEQEGSTFSFTISLKLSTEEEISQIIKSQEQVQGSPINPAEVKLLVVEDNELNQKLAQKVLTDYGFTVDLAENGKVGVERVINSD
ncbi:MAG: hypothetical protein IH946_03070, partial [Bacteroidetes bacterium]|nr:hypothetical protein [Bacteroidota bacterium]